MISDRKIIKLYQQAVENGHPDPDRAILGRSELTKRKADFALEGKVGLFGISERKASGLGYEGLDDVDTSFDAMMLMDSNHFQETDDVNEMFFRTASIPNGTAKKDKYLKRLDEATEEAKKRFVWEGGMPVSAVTNNDEETIEHIETTGDEQAIKEVVKEKTASFKNDSIVRATSGLGVDSEDELHRYMGLLKETISKLA